MRRGRTDAETCRLNDWRVGTIVRGHEAWSKSAGTWTTWQITAIGDDCVLARTIRSERTENGAIIRVNDSVSHEHNVTFRHRDWTEVKP